MQLAIDPRKTYQSYNGNPRIKSCRKQVISSSYPDTTSSIVKGCMHNMFNFKCRHIFLF